MASSFIENLSSEFQKANNAYAPKAAKPKVLVYVEGHDDVAFWHYILSPYQAEIGVKFDIQPFAQGLEQGKTALTKLFPQTGAYLLVCVDSDYDYLLPDHSETAKAINTNPYILQTYAHSIENLKCYAPSLAHACVKATQNTSELIDLPDWLATYSQQVFLLFIWNLYLHNLHAHNDFTQTQFCDTIRLTETPSSTNYGGALATVKHRAEEKQQALEKDHPKHAPELVAFAEQLAKRGLTPETAYLFIQGHTLYNEVVLPLLIPICRALQDERRDKIKQQAQHEQEKRQKDENYRNSTLTLHAVLNHHYEFKDCFLYEKIRADAEAALRATK
jgi:hypothetical protein